jgi:hypothetical protein
MAEVFPTDAKSAKGVRAGVLAMLVGKSGKLHPQQAENQQHRGLYAQFARVILHLQVTGRNIG